MNSNSCFDIKSPTNRCLIAKGLVVRIVAEKRDNGSSSLQDKLENTVDDYMGTALQKALPPQLWVI